MTKRKTRKEINAVILKYQGTNNPDIIKFFGPVSGGLIAVGMGADLLLTGGLFSIGTFVFGGMGGLLGAVGAGGLLSENIKKSRTNAAAQTLECTKLVNGTLIEMESKLQKSFKKASAKAAAQKQKENFRSLAAEIEQDVKKLSPAFKIVSGGPLGADKYEFIVDKKKLLTLTQALRDMNQPPAPEEPTPDAKKIKELETRINELENPRIVRLDKKPHNPPSP